MTCGDCLDPEPKVVLPDILQEQWLAKWNESRKELCHFHTLSTYLIEVIEDKDFEQLVEEIQRKIIFIYSCVVFGVLEVLECVHCPVPPHKIELPNQVKKNWLLKWRKKIESSCETHAVAASLLKIIESEQFLEVSRSIKEGLTLIYICLSLAKSNKAKDDEETGLEEDEDDDEEEMFLISSETTTDEIAEHHIASENKTKYDPEILPPIKDVELKKENTILLDREPMTIREHLALHVMKR